MEDESVVALPRPHLHTHLKSNSGEFRRDSTTFPVLASSCSLQPPLELSNVQFDSSTNRLRSILNLSLSSILRTNQGCVQVSFFRDLWYRLRTGGSTFVEFLHSSLLWRADSSNPDLEIRCQREPSSPPRPSNFVSRWRKLCLILNGNPTSPFLDQRCAIFARPFGLITPAIPTNPSTEGPLDSR